MKMLWLDLLSTTLEAEAPSAVRMADLSEMDELLKTVKWLLDVLTPESIDYCCMAIASCTKSAGILKGVVSLLYNRTVLEPKKCHLYAQLCSKLDYKLATFPPDEADGKEIKFRRLLITKCQNVFEGDGELWDEVDQMTALDQELERSEKERLVKLGKLGNIRLIGELWKQKMLTDRIVHSVIQKLLGMDKEGWPSVQNAEAVAQLLRTIGKQSDERLISRQMIDTYLKRMNEMAIDAMGALRVVSTVHSILLLRANNWEPNPQAGVTKIQSKFEENPSDTNDSQEDESDVLKRKTTCLLEEYFKEANTGKALRCIEELNSPSHHSEVVKEAISTGLERIPPSTDQVMCLLEYLLAKNVITANDVAYGCASCGYLMDDIGARNPSALHCFGEIMGKLVLVGGLDFGVVEEVLRKTEYDLFRKAVFNATLWAVNFSLSAAARSVLDAQASEIKACMLCCGLF